MMEKDEPSRKQVRYEDFEIELAERDGGQVEARVLSSPWGHAEAPLVLPFPMTSIEACVEAVEREVMASFSPPAVGATTALLSLSTFGSQLFDTLIPLGNMRTAFDASRAQLREGVGLRMRISFPSKRLSGPLAALPWELMRHEETFLGQKVCFPIVRTIDVPGPLVPLGVEGTLRVLLIEALPKDFSKLGSREEIREIRKALKKLEREGVIEIEILRRPNLLALKDKLRESEFHVLHYIGHGYFGGPEDPEGCLLFEDENRKGVPVWGAVLADLLQSREGLRLVVLNSCVTGAFPRRHASSALGGVAAALAVRAMPAVVAMQFPISDAAAILFSQRFYRYLSQGSPIDAAVADARQDLRLSTQSYKSYEWINPVLFLRGKDGILFNVAPRPEKIGRSGAVIRTSKTSESSPVHLGFVSFGPDPWGEARECSDHVLDLTKFFEGRFIRHRDLWNTEVYPRIRDFLKTYAPRGSRAMTLDFAAHLSVAYAVGTCLEVKSGLDVTVIQRGQRGSDKWSMTSKAEPRPFTTESLLVGEPARLLDPEAADTALAVGISNPVFEDVAVYLERANLRVGRILPATLAPEPSQNGVRDGSHAFELAHQIARIIRCRNPREREATLHLFISSPNALVFYLGQLAGTFGDVQVYEHAFRDPTRLLKYEPSVRLPPPRQT